MVTGDLDPPGTVLLQVEWPEGVDPTDVRLGASVLRAGYYNMNLTLSATGEIMERAQPELVGNDAGGFSKDRPTELRLEPGTYRMENLHLTVRRDHREFRAAHWGALSLPSPVSDATVVWKIPVPATQAREVVERARESLREEEGRRTERKR